MEDFLKRIVAFMVYVGAYAAIPFLAKRLSGTLGNLTGMVNDRSKGVFDRTRNKVSEALRNHKAGRKALKEKDAMNQASKQELPQRLTPRNIWSSRKRLKQEARMAYKEWKAGGYLPGLSRFTQDDPEAEPVDKTSTAEPLAEETTPLTTTEKLAVARQRMKQKRSQKRARMGDLAKQFTGHDFGKEMEEFSERSASAIFEKDLVLLEEVVLDTDKAFNVRFAAAKKLVKSGFVKPIRVILEEAYQSAQDSPNAPLVQIVKTLKHSNDLYNHLKDLAPDIAKSAFDDQNNILAIPKKRFLVTESIEKSSQWDSSTWEDVLNLPNTHPDYIEKIKIGNQERNMSASDIRKYIFKNQGKGILNSPQARRKTKQDVLELIQAGLKDINDEEKTDTSKQNNKN